MRNVFKSYGRAFALQFNFRMVLLSLLPSLLALILWGILLYYSLQPLIDLLQDRMVDTVEFQKVGAVLTFLGLFALKAFIVPLIAMWLLLPVMLITALIFVAFMAMPVINRTVSRQYFPDLEKKHGSGWLGNAGYTVVNLVAFLVIWAVSLPFCLVFNLGLIVQPVLIGWFTYRVMSFDALSRHADRAERLVVMRRHRWQLWAVGIISGLAGALPGLIWLGGVQWLFALPVFAAIAIWLYVLVFMFSGFWFQLFCLDALHDVRNFGAVNMNAESVDTALQK